MLFHLYIVFISIVLIIELVCALLTSLWLKSLVDLQAKVLLFMSAIASVFAIVMAEIGSSTMSMALVIVSIVVGFYALCHKMTNVNATIDTAKARKAKATVKREFK